MPDKHGFPRALLHTQCMMRAHETRAPCVVPDEGVSSRLVASMHPVCPHTPAHCSVSTCAYAGRSHAIAVRVLFSCQSLLCNALAAPAHPLMHTCPSLNLPPLVHTQGGSTPLLYLQQSSHTRCACPLLYLYSIFLPLVRRAVAHRCCTRVSTAGRRSLGYCLTMGRASKPGTERCVVSCWRWFSRVICESCCVRGSKAGKWYRSGRW